jgi:PDZ domain-containing protein
VYITEKNKSGIKVGDELISYDGIKLTSITDFIKYINSKQVNDKIKIEYKRNNRIKETYSIIYEEKSKKYVGISAIKIYKIKSDDNIEVKSKSNESGPSGGLITTLSIYDALIKKDLTKGYKIVGTGTISDDGTVGEIGSVTFKLASAVKDKADIFLCPKENYKDATKYAKKHKYDIIIKEVASFDEAVDYLNKLEEK